MFLYIYICVAPWLKMFWFVFIFVFVITRWLKKSNFFYQEGKLVKKKTEVTQERDLHRFRYMLKKIKRLKYMIKTLYLCYCENVCRFVMFANVSVLWKGKWNMQRHCCGKCQYIAETFCIWHINILWAQCVNIIWGHMEKIAYLFFVPSWACSS